MTLAGRKLLRGFVLATALVLALGIGGGAAMVYRRFAPVRMTSSAMLSNLRLLSEALEISEESLQLAEQLVRTPPQAPADRIGASRQRGAYLQLAIERCRKRAAKLSFPSQAVHEVTLLLNDTDEVLQMALKASPSGPVAAATIATAPSTSSNPDEVGVLRGKAQIVEKSVGQIRRSAETLARRVEAQIVARHNRVPRFNGGTALQWCVCLCLAASLLGILMSLAGLAALARTPQRTIESSIRAEAKRDSDKAVRTCHKHIDRMLDLAEEMTRGGS